MPPLRYCSPPSHLGQAMFYWRLLHSTIYRTTKPSEADLFFVPILTRPKLQSELTRACNSLAPRAAELPRHLPHLTPANAHRHLILLSKEHSTAVAANCTGWFYKPTGLASRFIRVAYSHAQPEALRWSAYWQPPDEYLYEDPHGDFPHLFSVPFPSSVHARLPHARDGHAGDGYAQPAAAIGDAGGGGSGGGRGGSGGSESSRSGHGAFSWDTSLPRKYSAIFIGSSMHGDVEVRERLASQCLQMNRSASAEGRPAEGQTAGGGAALGPAASGAAESMKQKGCLFLKATLTSGSDGKQLPIKRQADFCLEPAGGKPFFETSHWQPPHPSFQTPHHTIHPVHRINQHRVAPARQTPPTASRSPTPSASAASPSSSTP